MKRPRVVKTALEYILLTLEEIAALEQKVKDDKEAVGWYKAPSHKEAPG